MPWLRSPITAFLRRRLHHLHLSFIIAPSRRDWWEAAAIFSGAGALALTLGLRSRLVRPELMREPWPMYLLLPSLLAVTPGLSEEIVFRGLLLPHPREPATPRGRWLAAILSLVTFVLWHPVNGRTRRPDARHVFTDHRFLLQTVILGSACMVAYTRSGSIWPPALMHWLTVTTWIVALGGRRHLRDGLSLVAGDQRPDRPATAR